MTMIRFGAECTHEGRHLSDAAFRTYFEAMSWSVQRQLDDIVPHRDVHRFTETRGDVQAAVDELLDKGWWLDLGDHYDIGHRFRWQWTSDQVEKHRAKWRDDKRRRRAQKSENNDLGTAPTASNSTQLNSKDSTGGLHQWTPPVDTASGSSAESSDDFGAVPSGPWDDVDVQAVGE